MICREVTAYGLEFMETGWETEFMSKTSLIRRRRRRTSKQSLVSPAVRAQSHSHQYSQQEIQDGECRCGEPIHLIYVDRCEDCWALDQVRWSGKSKRVRLLFND